MSEPGGAALLCLREDGSPAIEVHLDAGTVWLSQQQLADLFGTSRENITIHLRNIFDEGELDPRATSKDRLQVRQEGSRTVRRTVLPPKLNGIVADQKGANR